MSERERRPRERPHSQNYARSNGARKREMGVQTSSIVFRPADSAATKGMADAAAGHSDCTALRKPAYIIGFSPAAATGSVALDFSFAPLPSAADRRRHRARRIPICLSPSLLPLLPSLPPSTTVGNFSCNLWIFCCPMKKRRERGGENNADDKQ